MNAFGGLRWQSAVVRFAKAIHLSPQLVTAAARLEIWRRARRKGLRARMMGNGVLSITCPSTTLNIRREVRLSLKHAAYGLDVVDDFDYYHGAVEPAITDGTGVVDYSVPGLHVMRPSGDVLQFTGFPEPEATTKQYLEFAALQSGALVLDFGAYCGGSTIAFARAVGPEGRVVAFEPDFMNVTALRANLAASGLANVSVVEAGIWSETTSLQFVAEGNMGSAIDRFLPRAVAGTTISAMSLSDAVNRACDVSGLDRVAFIKIDIEGAEVEVLRAGQGILSVHRPRLVIEPHRVPGGRSPGGLNTEEIISLLGGLGYASTIAYQGAVRHPLVLAAST